MPASEPAIPPSRAGPPRSATFFLMVAGVVITLFGVQQLSWLLGPLLLAVFVIAVVYPVCTWLTGHGVPRAMALGVLLLIVFSLVASLVAVIVYALSRLAGLLPEYSGRMQGIVTDVSVWLGEAGINSPQAAELLEIISLPEVALWLTSQIPPLVTVGSLLVFTGTVLVFLGIEVTQLPLRVQWLGRDYPVLTETLAASMSGLRRFIGITTIFAVIVGVLDTVFLMLLGIPLAALWGVLAAVCNYIPYLGFLVGMAPPALLALLLDGWQAMLLVIVVYVVLNFVVTSVLPPR